MIYERPNGNRTSPISSSLHGVYSSKGWVAVEVYSEPEPVRVAPVEVSAELAEYGRHDRVGVWRRGGDVSEVSCRHAATHAEQGLCLRRAGR